MQTHFKTKFTSAVFLYLLIIINAPSTAQEIWGMTKYGGEHDKGVIFKMDENATAQEVVFSFETVQNPEGGLTEYKEGIFFGLSHGGGKYGLGVIYKFELEKGKFTSVIDFDGVARGSGGRDRMIYASNGKMYGTTLYGGIHDKGILFEFDPITESFKKLYDFDGQANGARPEGRLLEAGDGKLYGTTASGGTNDDGILFSYDTSTDVFTKLVDYESMVSGAMPLGSLIQLSDGILYGMTQWGGSNDDGLIFSYNPASSQYTVLIEFDKVVTGRNPIAGLVTTPNGKVYGITPRWGPDDVGFLFEYIPQTNTFSKKVEFTVLFEAGWSCVAASNGNLYWVPEPELHSPPNIIGYDPQNDSYITGATALVGSREPSLFFNSFMQASNGKLYFIANATQNDIRNENTLYEYDAATDEFTNYFKFSGIETGEWPYGSLHQGADGLLYGTTYLGGAYHQGVIFRIDPETYNFTKLVDFDREEIGAKPIGGVVQADNNMLYGLTSEGGAFDKGVIYQFDPASEAFKKLSDFDGTNGENPDGDLVKGNNGKLYGVTSSGGTYGEGVLFEINPEDGSYKKLIDFQGVDYGANPNPNALVVSSNGTIYGTASNGGIYDKGVLFEYRPADGNFEKIIEYKETGTGNVPKDLIQGADKKLYAATGPGEITRIDPENSTYTKSVFDSNYLNSITGRLLEAKNGKFYWMDRGYIWYRATDFSGGIHEYDINTDTYRLVLEFSWSNGSNPENTSLVQLQNLTAPVAQCKNTTLYLNETGKAALLPADIDNGSTGEGIEFTLNKSNFSCNDVGENDVELTVTDTKGTTATCTAVVTIADTIAPVAACKDVDLFLDASGNASLEASEVDNGSADACGIASMTLDVSSFDCQSIGENEVVLTVTDNNGNISSCASTVTVKDTISPAALCKNIEIVLDDTGMAALEVSDVDDGSYDACGIKSMSLSNTSFSCGDLGENAVNLTVEDNNGNVSVCKAAVLVTDNIAPEISCVSGVTQFLDPYQEDHLVLNTAWDAAASDNCTVASLECNIDGAISSKGASLEGRALVAGVHEVTWVAADDGGNTSSFTSVITIEKRPTTLTIQEREIDLDEAVIHVEALLKDEILGGGVEGKPLVFSIDEISKSAVTDENGVARVDFMVEDASGGQFDLTVGFDEDATYAGSVAESEIVTGTNLVPSAAVKVYPNPFVEKLYVEFTAPESANARIDLFDPAGRLVKNIFNQPVEAGSFYKTEYLPDHAGGSFLLYRLKIGATIFTGKILDGR